MGNRPTYDLHDTQLNLCFAYPRFRLCCLQRLLLVSFAAILSSTFIKWWPWWVWMGSCSVRPARSLYEAFYYLLRWSDATDNSGVSCCSHEAINELFQSRLLYLWSPNSEFIIWCCLLCHKLRLLPSLQEAWRWRGRCQMGSSNNTRWWTNPQPPTSDFHSNRCTQYLLCAYDNASKGFLCKLHKLHNGIYHVYALDTIFY